MLGKDLSTEGYISNYEMTIFRYSKTVMIGRQMESNMRNIKKNFRDT